MENKLIYGTICNSVPNMSTTLDEWIRFLSYESPEDLEFLESLDSKPITSLTSDELERYNSIKEEKELLESFKKYRNLKCTIVEYTKVQVKMRTSLEDYMKSKLTTEELNEANKTLDELRNKTSEEISLIIDILSSRYNSLSLLEAYILYKAKEIKYNKDTDETNRKIKEESAKRNQNLRRSIINEYGIK